MIAGPALVDQASLGDVTKEELGHAAFGYRLIRRYLQREGERGQQAVDERQRPVSGRALRHHVPGPTEVGEDRQLGRRQRTAAVQRRGHDVTSWLPARSRMASNGSAWLPPQYRDQ